MSQPRTRARRDDGNTICGAVVGLAAIRRPTQAGFNMIHAPTPRRERILAYGQSGSGKSSMWLAIANWIRKTNSTAKVHVLDTDRAWEAHRPEDGSLDGIVVAYEINEFDDYREAVEKIRGTGPDDWFVHDLADGLWDESQEAYVQKIYGEELDSFFLAGKAIGGDYGKDWAVIKKMYNRVAILYSRFPGHVLAVTRAKKVIVQDPTKKKNQFAADQDTVNKYGRIGWEPAGRDGLAHSFHTELFVVEVKPEVDYRITTVKDRKPFQREGGRRYLSGEKMTPDFVMTYLIRVAGWKP